jgi:folate-binding protein YgfZ
MHPDDYKAAREQAAIVVKEWYAIVRLSGSERISWLQGMVTNDVQRLDAGDGCYAAHLSAQGKMIAHMLILRSEDDLWLVLERPRIAALVAAFDKLLIMEDVQVIDESHSTSILAVIGPRAGGVLEACFGRSIDITRPYQHQVIDGNRLVVTNLGYDVWVPASDVAVMTDRLVKAGGRVVQRETWDVLRTELGWPLFGIDIDETTIMPELGEQGISYDKGCYVGQEVVAKVKYIGHVNRRFVGLIVEGDAPPAVKSTIRKNGKDVGYTTSGVFSPGLNAPIALGFVTRAAYAPGTAVEIISDGRLLAATISDLPFNPNRSVD